MKLLEQLHGDMFKWLHNLKTGSLNTYEDITFKLLEHTRREIEYRLNIFRNSKGCTHRQVWSCWSNFLVTYSNMLKMRLFKSWGFVKNQVLRTKVIFQHNLKTHSFNTFEDVTLQMLKHTRREIEYQLNDARSTHIGVYGWRNNKKYELFCRMLRSVCYYFV